MSKRYALPKRLQGEKRCSTWKPKATSRWQRVSSRASTSIRKPTAWPSGEYDALVRLCGVVGPSNRQRPAAL